MTLIQKRVLFYFSVLAFSAVGFFITSYAMGYHYVFLKNQFIQTGSINLDAQVTAKVFINDKNEGSTSFFGNSFSRNGLLPKEYKVRLERENYLPWQKKINIEEGLVSDFPFIYLIKEKPTVDLVNNEKISSLTFDFFNSNSFNDSDKNIVLIAEFFSVSPKNILNYETKNGNIFFIVKFGKEQILYRIKGDITEENINETNPEIIASGADGFKISQDKKKIAWFNKTEVWVYWIEDVNYQPYKKAGDKELVSRTSNLMEDIHWFEDNNHLFLVTDESVIFTELDGRGGRNNYTIYRSGEINNSMLAKDNSKKLYILDGNKVRFLEI